MADEKLAFTEHLEELRKRLIICLIAVACGFSGSYYFADHIFRFLSAPLYKELPQGSSFIFTGLTDAFFTYIKLSFFTGICLAIPVILYQTWRFVAPGLYESEKRYVAPFIFLGTIFFVAGLMFGYYIVFPVAFKFFVSYSTDSIKIMPSIKEYLSFSCMFLLAFGAIFEIPILLFFLVRIGIVSETTLRKNRKYAILLAFILAAILTPTPDVVNQVLMAVPIILLYELSLVMIKLMPAKKQEPETETEQEPDPAP
jgi:sec-independent protein translocase protein TatC